MSLTANVTSAGLLAMARAMDQRSAERYRELAVAFEVSCNQDSAAAFRTLAEIEDGHAGEIAVSPAVPVPPLTWFDDSPEISDPDSVHYMMLPWHAFDLARRLEERCQAHFLSLAKACGDADTQATALSLAEREARHAADMQARRDACPEPHRGWWEDQDGPNWEGD